MAQGYNARLDESLGSKDGKESSKSQSFASRRHESEGMEKAEGHRKFSGNKSSGQGSTGHVHGQYHRPNVLKHVKNWVSGFDSSTDEGIATLYTGERAGE